MKNFKKGFTLIELLVVIAIIGILASVVLISTSRTRAQGSDASIRTNLATAKLQAEMYSNTTGCFGADCTAPALDCADIVSADPLFDRAIQAAGRASSGDPAAVTCSVSATGGDMAMSVPLRTDPALIWCVDSAGYSDAGTAASSDGLCQ